MNREADLAAPLEGGWLTRGVAGIGLASFFSDVSHEIPTALLPGLLTSLGAPASALGLIEGVSDGLSGIARLAGGALAEDPGRRRAIAMGGYSTTAVLMSMTGAASATWQVGVLRAGGWTARGLRVPARNALLADAVPETAYGRAYGFERAMDNLGAIAGPVLAMLLVGTFGVRRTIFLSVLAGVAATAAIFYAVRSTPRVKSTRRRPVRLTVRPVLRGRLGRMMIGVGAFELGNVAATLLILRATQLLQPQHGRQAATQLAIGLYVAYNAAGAASSVPAGRIGDRLGTARVLAFGVALFAVAYLGFAAGGSSVAALLPWFVAAGIGIGCVETSEHAAVADLAPPDVRSSAFGVLAAVQSAGNFVASAVAGLLWSAASARVAFMFVSVCMLVSLAAMFATRRHISGD